MIILQCSYNIDVYKRDQKPTKIHMTHMYSEYNIELLSTTVSIQNVENKSEAELSRVATSQLHH